MITSVIFIKANDMKTQLNIHLEKSQGFFEGAMFNCCNGIHWKVFAVNTYIGPETVIIYVYIDNIN